MFLHSPLSPPCAHLASPPASSAFVCSALIQRCEHLHIPYVCLHAREWRERVCLALLPASSLRLPAWNCLLPVLSLRVGWAEKGGGCGGNQTKHTASRMVVPREEATAEGTVSTRLGNSGEEGGAADPLSLAPRQQTSK